MAATHSPEGSPANAPPARTAWPRRLVVALLILSGLLTFAYAGLTT